MKIPIFRTSNYCNKKYGVTARDCAPEAPCDGAVYAGPLPNVIIAYRFEVEINSLEDLVSLEKKVGKPLILSCSDSYYPDELSIEIYDDWRE